MSSSNDITYTRERHHQVLCLLEEQLWQNVSSELTRQSSRPVPPEHKAAFAICAKKFRDLSLNGGANLQAMSDTRQHKFTMLSTYRCAHEKMSDPVSNSACKLLAPANGVYCHKHVAQYSRVQNLEDAFKLREMGSSCMILEPVSGFPVDSHLARLASWSTTGVASDNQPSLERFHVIQRVTDKHEFLFASVLIPHGTSKDQALRVHVAVCSVDSRTGALSPFFLDPAGNARFPDHELMTFANLYRFPHFTAKGEKSVLCESSSSNSKCKVRIEIDVDGWIASEVRRIATTNRSSFREPVQYDDSRSATPQPPREMTPMRYDGEEDDFFDHVA
jgi:hypothetical protein